MDILYFSVIIGSLLLIAGIINLIRRKNFVRESDVISGVVIDIRLGYVNNQKSYFPIVKYYDKSTGTEETYYSDTGYNPSKYVVGDNIELRYLNNGVKKEIYLNTWFVIWGASFLFIAIGLMFSIIGYAILLSGRY